MDFLAFKNSARGLWVGRGLVFIGGVITLCLVYFNGKHGFSLGQTFDEAVGLAILHGAVDPVTALLVSAAAIAFAWGYRLAGVAICAVAIVFTSFSVATTAGFMANRLAGLYGQKAALAELDKQSKWWNSATYRRDLSRGEQIANRAEIRATFKEKVKVASQVVDPQAMQIAGVFGWQVESVQRWLNLISSGMGQAMKYMALLVGFFLLSNRDEIVGVAHNKSDGSASPGSSGSGGLEPRKGPQLAYSSVAKPPDKVAKPQDKVSSASPSAPKRKLSRDEVWDHLRRQADGREPAKSSYQNGKDFGHPQRTVHRWQKRLSHQAKSKMRKVMGNGGGYHHAPSYN